MTALLDINFGINIIIIPAVLGINFCITIHSGINGANICVWPGRFNLVLIVVYIFRH